MSAFPYCITRTKTDSPALSRICVDTICCVQTAANVSFGPPTAARIRFGGLVWTIPTQREPPDVCRSAHATPAEMSYIPGIGA